MPSSPSVAKATGALVEGFVRLYPDEAARMLERLPGGEVVRFLAAEATPRAVALIERLTPEMAADVLQEIDDESARHILPALDPAHAAALLARLDPDRREKLVSALEPGVAKELVALMSYPVDSAGSLMDPRVTTFRPDGTVGEALGRLRGRRYKRIHDVFLVDRERQLVGAVPLQAIAIASPEDRLGELAGGAPVSVRDLTTREEVVETLSQRKLTSLPVVDFEGRLVGVIRHDALITAVQEEASANIQTMVGASKEERALSRVTFAIRKRLPWLEVNLGTAFLAAAVVGLFEQTIARFTALAVLLPVVAGQSGNTGAQALAVTMRGLVLREVRVRHALRVAFKEVRVGAVNGCAVALTTSLGVYLWSRSVGLTVVIGLSMVISMVAAGLAGAAIPMVLTALGQDPAQSSSIILTTVTDVVGFFSFLGIATLLAGTL